MRAVFPSPVHCQVTQCGSTLSNRRERIQNCQGDGSVGKGSWLLTSGPVLNPLSAQGGRTELISTRALWRAYTHTCVERELVLLWQMTQVQFPAPPLLSHNCLINPVPTPQAPTFTCVHTDWRSRKWISNFFSSLKRMLDWSKTFNFF